MKEDPETERFEFTFPRLLAMVLILFPFLAATAMSILFVDRLPEAVPLHWTTFGQADGEGSRLLFVVLFPALQLMHLLARGASRDGTRMNHLRLRLGLLVGTVLLFVQAALFAMQTGPSITEAFLVPALIGGLLVVGGFLMSEAKPNMLFGIRTSWTLGDAGVWEQTHQIAGPLTMVTGGLCMVPGVLLPPSVALGATLGITLLSAVLQICYSFVVAQKLRNQRLSKSSA